MRIVNKMCESVLFLELWEFGEIGEWFGVFWMFDRINKVIDDGILYL